jgi:N-acetylglucosamine malate deacetylase 1
MVKYLMNWFKRLYRHCRQLVIRLFLYLRAKPLDVSACKTMIIAPHPDDEVFGMGGLICKKLSKGEEIVIVFLTDGEKSILQNDPKEIASKRIELAKQVAKRFGIPNKNLYFFHLPDGEMGNLSTQRKKQVIKDLVKLMKKHRSEEIYCSHFLDRWSDHIAASYFIKEALSEQGSGAKLYFYCVWMWHSMSLMTFFKNGLKNFKILSIEQEMIKKREAINLYKNALDQKGMPYIGILPRSLYRAFEWSYEVFEEIKL